MPGSLYCTLRTRRLGLKPIKRNGTLSEPWLSCLCKTWMETWIDFCKCHNLCIGHFALLNDCWNLTAWRLLGLFGSRTQPYSQLSVTTPANAVTSVKCHCVRSNPAKRIDTIYRYGRKQREETGSCLMATLEAKKIAIEDRSGLMAPQELVLKRTLSAPEMPKEDGIAAVTVAVVANYRSWEWLPVSGPHKVQFNDWSNEMEREINSDSLGHDFWVWLKFYFQSCTLHSFNYLHSQGRKWMSVTWLCDHHLWRLQDVLPALKKLNSTRWRRQQKTSGTCLRQKLAAYPQSVFPDQICKAACPGTGAQRCLRGQRVVQMWRSMRKRTSPRRNQGDSPVLPLLFVSFAEMIFFIGLAGYPVFVA